MYNTVSGALSNFDLTNADDVKAATAYLRENLASLIKDINRQMNERDEDSD